MNPSNPKNLCYRCSAEQLSNDPAAAVRFQNSTIFYLEVGQKSELDTEPTSIVHAVYLQDLEHLFKQLEFWLSSTIDPIPCQDLPEDLLQQDANRSFENCLSLYGPDGMTAELKMATEDWHRIPPLKNLAANILEYKLWRTEPVSVPVKLVICRTSLSLEDSENLVSGSIVTVPESQNDNWQVDVVFADHALTGSLDPISCNVAVSTQWQEFDRRSDVAPHLRWAPAPSTQTETETETEATIPQHEAADEEASSDAPSTASANAAISTDSPEPNDEQMSKYSDGLIWTQASVHSTDCVGTIDWLPLYFKQKNSVETRELVTPEADLGLENGVNACGHLGKFLNGYALFVEKIDIVS